MSEQIKDPAIAIIDTMFAKNPSASFPIRQGFTRSPHVLRLLSESGDAYSLTRRISKQGSIDGFLQFMGAVIYTPPSYLRHMNNDPVCVFYDDTPTPPNKPGWHLQEARIGWTLDDFFAESRKPEIMKYSTPFSTKQDESIVALLGTSKVMAIDDDADTLDWYCALIKSRKPQGIRV